jgi:glycosyltransferase involved in cell wall biosynthesis
LQFSLCDELSWLKLSQFRGKGGLKMSRSGNSVLILGTRGIPANHGGFETFAEQLALFLVERGWDVSVYCQEEVAVVEQRITTEHWRGIQLIKIQVASAGPRATLEFDWRSIRDAVTRPGLCLVLGYNSAILLPYLRLHGRKVLTNMDGIEWRRAKWSRPIRAWFWLNEWIAAWSSHRLVADHPEIAGHLATRRPRSATVVIPYGGVPVEDSPRAPVGALGLEPGGYLVSIARLEPENNIHTIVEAFSRRRRDARLVVLGDLRDGNPYHRKVKDAASDEVVFPGSIYEPAITAALRFHARAYLHGHTVGGTNPSLVEALWAGNAVVAHDNAYNRWTAGEAGIYFVDAKTCDGAITRILGDDELVARCGLAARERARSVFSWSEVLFAYERECLSLLQGRSGAAEPASAVQGRVPRWT